MYTIFAIIFIHVPGSLFLFLSVKYFSALPCYIEFFSVIFSLNSGKINYNPLKKER